MPNPPRSTMSDPAAPTQRQEPRRPGGTVLATVEDRAARQRAAMKEANDATAAWFDSAVDAYPGGATSLAEESGASEGDISKMRSGERPVQYRLCWFLLRERAAARRLLWFESEHARFAPPKEQRKVTHRQIEEATFAIVQRMGLLTFMRQELAKSLGVTEADIERDAEPAGADRLLSSGEVGDE